MLRESLPSGEGTCRVAGPSVPPLWSCRTLVSDEGSAPGHGEVTRGSRASMSFNDGAQLRDSELCHQSGKNEGKCIPRGALHLGYQPV